MDVELLLVPYDSAQRDVRMGAGPAALVAAGLPERLGRAGHAVVPRIIELPPAAWRAEIRSAFDLAAAIAEAVRGARAAGRLPVVLAGNCNAALGVVAGLGAGSAVCWCDAHGDFNTPETTTGGFLDGMALATLTGRCWRPLAAGVPGFAPVREDAVWLIGARDLDPAEARALDASAVHRVPAAAVGAAFARAVRDACPPAAPLYVHLDLDVLDVAEGRANAFAAPGGVAADALVAWCRALGAPAALTLSAYDPAHDADGRIAAVAIRAVEALLAGRAGRGDGALGAAVGGSPLAGGRARV